MSETLEHVRFENVAKSYDGKTFVVEGLDLQVKRGEFLTLLGPSGSGKSTVLMLLAGFEAPTHGKILIDGRSVNRIPPQKRNIGVVFQNYALFPHMTVRNNLRFPLSARGITGREADRKIDRVLDMVRLGEFGARYPKQLSGGQQQRVAMARALVFEPSIVLMDEPLGALDKQLREHMQLEVKHIQKKLGLTVVFVTHDQDEALSMSDRVAVFGSGSIQQIGTPKELYEASANPFVAGFIGDNNTYHGTVHLRDENGLVIRLQSGLSIRAKGSRHFEPGTEVNVSIRPERISTECDGHEGINEFNGEVSEIVYLGDHLRAYVSIQGHTCLVLRAPIEDEPKIRLSGPIRLRIPPHHVHLLPAA